MLGVCFLNRLGGLLRVGGLLSNYVSARHASVLFDLSAGLWLLKLVPWWPMIILVLQRVGPLRCAHLDRLFV